jgi:hypothetical protein
VSVIKYGKPRGKCVRVVARQTSQNGSITSSSCSKSTSADSIGGSEQVGSALDAVEQLQHNA